MAFDFVSEVDKKFFSDNLLLSEDWDNIQVDPVEDVSDFVSLLDSVSTLNANDFMSSLPDELELPVLDNEDILMPDDLNRAAVEFCPDPVRDLSDSSDSGLDCGSSGSPILVKDEPLSPASSHGSDTILDTINTTQILMETGISLPTSFSGLPSDIKLESPPLTPERDSQPDVTCVTLPPPPPSHIHNKPTNGVKIDFTNPQVLSATSLPLTTNILTSSNIKVISAQPPALSPNMAQVLNTKIKIQPKPPLQTLQTPTPLPTPAPGKPLVLTPEQFAKLTSQGVLKFHNPLDQSQVTVGSSPSPTPSPLTTETAPSLPITTEIHNVHDKLAKRQQRMIKNRESACLSRKRKKEYLSTMEKKLQNSVDENNRLREQNERLKKCIQSLQSENQKLRTSFSVGVSAKKATCLMAVLLLVSLNIGPLTNIFLGGQMKDPHLARPVSEDYVHHGRALMSFNENSTDDLPSVDGHTYLNKMPNLKTINAALEGLKQRYASASGPTTSDLMVVRALEQINIPATMCPSYFNSSESQRLMKELTGWVLAHKAGLKAATAEGGQAENGEHTKPPNRPHPRKRYAPPRKLKAALKGAYNNRNAGPNPSAAYEVQLFTGSDGRYEDFFQAVQIRNDTFYVVSFRRDHLLLPATAHNKTMRPRMSLLMPAQPSNSENDTSNPSEGNISMMQIDCEVTATKLLQLSKSAFPENMDEMSRQNQTAPPAVNPDRQRKKWQPNQKWRRKP